MADKERGVNPLTGRKYNIPSNPGGRPKGSKNRVKTALDKTGKDPVMELIKIAELLNGNPLEPQRKALEAATKIWMELLEYKQAKKKATTKEDAPEASKQAAEAAFDLLKELENDNANTGTKGTSNKTGVADGQSSLEAETSSEEDLQDGQGQ